MAISARVSGSSTKQYQSAIIAVVSDLHVGSTVALCPPGGVGLDDGGVYKPSRAQEGLGEWWADYWKLVDTIRKGASKTKQKTPLITVVNGDLVDGNHHGTTQIFSASTEAMEAAAVDLLKPIRAKSDNFFVVRGTPAHVKQGAQSEEAIARALGADKHPKGSNSFYRLILTVGGRKFDFAHHIGTNSVPWTKGTNIRAEILRVIQECASRGIKAPDYVIRSHAHAFADTGLNFGTRGLVTPAWQLTTEFAHKVARPLTSDVGGFIFIVSNGAADVIVKRYHTEPEPEIRL